MTVASANSDHLLLPLLEERPTAVWRGAVVLVCSITSLSVSGRTSLENKKAKGRLVDRRPRAVFGPHSTRGKSSSCGPVSGDDTNASLPR